MSTRAGVRPRVSKGAAEALLWEQTKVLSRCFLSIEGVYFNRQCALSARTEMGCRSFPAQRVLILMMRHIATPGVHALTILLWLHGLVGCSDSKPSYESDSTQTSSVGASAVESSTSLAAAGTGEASGNGSSLGGDTTMADTGESVPDERCNRPLTHGDFSKSCPGDRKKYDFDPTTRRCYSNAVTCAKELSFPSFEECDSLCQSRSLTPRVYDKLEFCSPDEMEPLDGVDYKHARLEGQELVLDIGYGGGCKGLNMFKLCYGGVDTRDAEVPRVVVLLLHDTYGESCERDDDTTLRFSLRTLDSLDHPKVLIQVGEKKKFEVGYVSQEDLVATGLDLGARK